MVRPIKLAGEHRSELDRPSRRAEGAVLNRSRSAAKIAAVRVDHARHRQEDLGPQTSGRAARLIGAISIASRSGWLRSNRF